MKTWSNDNPKADLMLRKRTAIIGAARQSFLEGGYVQTSMDRIAAAARVSVKTVYRHFENKDDLFSAVMQAACSNVESASGTDPSRQGTSAYSWFNKEPRKALPIAGADYLGHVLSKEQLALYRVVTRDAHAFPELGRRYHEETIRKRNQVFAAYLDRWRSSEKWKVKDSARASDYFAALLRAGIFDEALHGIHIPSNAEIIAHARLGSACMLDLLDAGRL
jgi:TetR/AcrR family transcriptional repressor of mexJK operon